MKPCSMEECKNRRKMIESGQIASLSAFLNRCNSSCHNNPECSYRAETNRKMRHAYAEWFMRRV